MRAFLCTLALACAPVASAAETEIAPWGVGPRLGTVVIPGHMPVRFPAAAREDVDADGNLALRGVRGDVQLGADAVYYAGHAWRLGALANLGFGRRFAKAELIFHYDRSVATYQGLDFLAGGGLGVGAMRFRGEGESRLGVPYYPFRVSAGAISHQDPFAIQLDGYIQLDIPSNQYYTARDGTETTTSGGIYASFGLGITGYIGDFDFRSRR